MANTILDCPKMQDYLGVIDNMYRLAGMRETAATSRFFSILRRSNVI